MQSPEGDDWRLPDADLEPQAEIQGRMISEDVSSVRLHALEFQGVNKSKYMLNCQFSGLERKGPSFALWCLIDTHVHGISWIISLGPELPPQCSQRAGYVHRLDLRQILFQVSDARGEHRSWFIRFRKRLCVFYPAACSLSWSETARLGILIPEMNEFSVLQGSRTVSKQDPSQK